MNAETRAKELLLAETGNREGGLPQVSWYSLLKRIAQALRQAENEAEQRAIDRCRQIISTAIAGDNADAESMRRLLLAAFDPRWDRVASIINPKD